MGRDIISNYSGFSFLLCGLRYPNDTPSSYYNATRWHRHFYLVLEEFVVRELKKKHPPNSIQMERTWAVGNRNWKPDITMINDDGKATFIEATIPYEKDGETLETGAGERGKIRMLNTGQPSGWPDNIMRSNRFGVWCRRNSEQRDSPQTEEMETGQ